MAVFDNKYKRNKQKEYRVKEAELGRRYRTDEALQGESFTQFVNRIKTETINDIKPHYPAWKPMPNESDKEFRKRLVGKTLGEPKRYSAWERMPNESDKEFRKRLVGKKL